MTEKAVALVALGWLIGAVLLMARSIRKARELVETLALRHPETYDALGRPRPGFLYSPRRSRFTEFLGRREYENLDDHELSTGFEQFRKSETRLVLSLLASLAIVAMLLMAVRLAA